MRYCSIHVRVKSEFERKSDNMAWFSKCIAKTPILKAPNKIPRTIFLTAPISLSQRTTLKE